MVSQTTVTLLLFNRFSANRRFVLHDETDLSLRSDSLRHVIPMLIRIVQAKDIIDMVEAEFLQLRKEFLVMIDHILGSQLFNPLNRFWSGRRSDYGESRQTGKLQRDGSNAPSGTDDQNRFVFVGFRMPERCLADQKDSPKL